MIETTFNIKNTDIAELFSKAEDLKCEVEELQEKLEVEEQVKEDYYTPKSPYEIYGLNEREFC